MKKLFFSVFLLSCLCLIARADILLGQYPSISTGGSNVKVMGRPWETDETASATPLDFFPGRGPSQITGPQRLNGADEGRSDQSLLNHNQVSILRVETNYWSRFRMIFHNLFSR